VNGAQLSAMLQQHKLPVLGAAAAGVVLLGLRSRKKSSGAAVAAGPRPAGTLPAAAVVPAGGPDNSAFQVYDSLHSELGAFMEQQAAQTNARSGISSVPPIASTLFAPAGTGQLVGLSDGTTAEIESDGSLFGLSAQQGWQQWEKAKGQVTAVSGPAPLYYSTAGNVSGITNKGPIAKAAG
jgi:hypothetical protein